MGMGLATLLRTDKVSSYVPNCLELKLVVAM